MEKEGFAENVGQLALAQVLQQKVVWPPCSFQRLGIGRLV